MRWIVLLLLASCSRERERERANVPDASAPAPDANVVVDAAPAKIDAEPIALEDRCKRHDDCVAVNLYPDGDLRCCLACVPQRAANKTSADAFIAMCARERPMRECPVYDCVAPPLDPKCVAGRCMLAPRQ